MNVDNNNLYYDSSEAENLSKYIVEPDITVATPEDGRKDYIFKDVINRAELVGTMPENTDINERLELDSEYIIPKGYHDGTGRIYTGTLSDYTYGTAVPEHVANNEIFWVNGERLKGTLDLDMNDQVGNATSDDILEDMIAWVNRKKVVGTIPVLPRHDESLMAGQSYQLPRGYEGGESVISAVDLATQTPGDIGPMDVPVGKVGWANGIKIEGAFDIDAEIDHRMAGTDATMEDVKEGKGFYSNKLGLVTYGTMPDHTGEEPRELLNGQTFNIPEGYYDGNSQITVKALKDITVASATAKDILLNKTAWVNGELIVGQGYQYVTDASDTTATEYDITEGKTAYIEGHKVTGKNTYDFTYWKSYDTNNFDDTPVAISVPTTRWATIGYIRVDIYDDNGLSILSTYERETLYAGETFTFDDDNIVINTIYGDNEIHIYDKLGRKFGITCIGYTITGRPSQGSEVPVVSMLLPGPEINSILRSLGSADKFVYSNTIPTDIQTHTISQAGYQPVLVWLDTSEEQSIAYWGSNANQILMNPDSSSIFNNTKYVSIDVTGWKSDNVTSLKQLFRYCDRLESIYGMDNWDTKNVENIGYILGVYNPNMDYIYSIIKKWNLENVTDISYLFSRYDGETIDLSQFKFGNKITNISCLFYDCPNLTEIKGADFLDSCEISNASSCFFGLDSLDNLDVIKHIHFSDNANIGSFIYNCPLVTEIDLSECNICQVDRLVSNCESLKILNLSNCNYTNDYALDTTLGDIWVYPQCVNLEKLIFKNNKIKYTSNELKYIKSIDISGCKIIHDDDSELCFYPDAFAKLDNVIGLNTLDVSDVTVLANSFFEAKYDVDISDWKLRDDVRFGNTFFGLEGSLKVGKINLQDGNANGLFLYAINHKYDGTNDSVTAQTYFDASGLNISKCTSLEGIFNFGDYNYQTTWCPLKIINTIGWDTSNITNMNHMFYNRNRLELILGIENWNMSNVTSLDYMFYWCGNIDVLDLSGWDISNVTSANAMFRNCIDPKLIICTEATEQKLKSLVGSDVSKYTFERPSDIDYWYDGSIIHQSILDLLQDEENPESKIVSFKYSNTIPMKLDNVIRIGRHSIIYSINNNGMYDIYYYTPKSKIILGENSDTMFDGFTNLGTIDSDKWETPTSTEETT